MIALSSRRIRLFFIPRERRSLCRRSKSYVLLKRSRPLESKTIAHVTPRTIYTTNLKYISQAVRKGSTKLNCRDIPRFKLYSPSTRAIAATFTVTSKVAFTPTRTPWEPSSSEATRCLVNLSLTSDVVPAVYGLSKEVNSIQLKWAGVTSCSNGRTIDSVETDLVWQYIHSPISNSDKSQPSESDSYSIRTGLICYDCRDHKSILGNGPIPNTITAV